ncbi:retinol dehydrogenase 12-like isoform X1 [Neophocaena asiaeorientalis asiaeorientalis]|uniref:Retinol dehydrogenase 12-like isoform X1 n=1 Tax=Neophocaena asiaeorientalis asiaeorientalis TaxID=1706337 RepID=A0A341D373_NEOAA|nr:retinol dehydrogenase 12-like isoform X1 [Neophocaena asiaeorientalis asiaeorientalis]
MSLWSLLNTPVWGPGSVLLILVLLLRLSVQVWHKLYLWDLQCCSTDLTGKIAVVTGANSGIGKAVSQELARRGARVILACRSQVRGQRALAEIQAASKSNRLLLGEVDLSSMNSIRSFAQWLLQEYHEIHLLVNNAAVCGFPTTLTPEGLDLTFATNYTGPFLLTNLLQGALQRAGSARVVNVSSFRQAHGYIDEEHLIGAGRPLTFNQNYDCSKLLLASFTGKLAQRLQGTGVTVNSVDPGVVYTKIMRHFSWPYHFLFWLLSFFFKVGSGGWGRALLLSVLYSSSSPVSLQDSKQGAIPVLYLCLAKELDGISGKHFNSSCVITLPPEAARDCHVAQSLWNTSVRLTNLDKVD